MVEWIGRIGRLAIAGLLIAGVYSETGLWTAIFCGLVAVQLEIVAWFMRMSADMVRRRSGTDDAILQTLERMAKIHGRRKVET